MDDMVFAFADAHLRNVAGRAVREAGLSCFGSHLRPGRESSLLTVQEANDARRDVAERLIRRNAPSARRLS